MIKIGNEIFTGKELVLGVIFFIFRKIFIVLAGLIYYFSRLVLIIFLTYMTYWLAVAWDCVFWGTFIDMYFSVASAVEPVGCITHNTKDALRITCNKSSEIVDNFNMYLKFWSDGYWSTFTSDEADKAATNAAMLIRLLMCYFSFGEWCKFWFITIQPIMPWSIFYNAVDSTFTYGPSDLTYSSYIRLGFVSYVKVKITYWACSGNDEDTPASNMFDIFKLPDFFNTSSFTSIAAKTEASPWLLPLFKADNADIANAGEFLTFVMVSSSENCLQDMMRTCTGI